MSIYKVLLSRDKNEAFLVHRDRQKSYEKAKNWRMYLAVFGGMLVITLISHTYGETAAALSAFVGTVWYILGYLYCESLWKKEKDDLEFMLALNEHEKSQPESSLPT